MMSKKHYIEVAKIIKKHIKNTGDTTEEVSPTEAIKYVAVDLAQVFINDNQRFDRKRFLTACGVNE